MNKLTLFIIIALLIAIVSIGSILIFMLLPSKAAGQNEAGFMYNTGGAFLTNLRDGRHYIKADIIIEVYGKGTIKSLEKNNYKIRDRIIDILGNIEEEDVERKDFKENLKNEIKEGLQNALKIDKIQEIYFNEFVIQ